MASTPVPAATTITDELPLSDPDTPYPLDPNRGVDNVQETDEDAMTPQGTQFALVPAETPSIGDLIPVEEETTPQPVVVFSDVLSEIPTEVNEDVVEESIISENSESLDAIKEAQQPIVDALQTEDDIVARNAFNNGYNLRKTTTDQHVYATLSIKEARRLYGDEVADAAIVEEIQNCIKKDVFEFQHREYKTRSQIPSKMFLTPKKLPNGNIDRMKARLVAGGHRQNRSL